MADPRGLRRLEFALAALGLTAGLSALLVALDAIRFHTAAFAEAIYELKLGAIEPEAVALLVLAGVDATILIAAARSLLRQVRAQRGFIRRLDVAGERQVDGRPVVIVADERPLAFCAGFLRPSVFVSTGTFALLGHDELRAVVAHEAHHAARRDPLRLLLAGALAAAFSVLPPLRSLRKRQAALAELAADAAAVRALGDAGPLASALLAFDGSRSPAVVGIAPERVDHLLGDARATDVPRVLLLAAGLVLAALIVVFLRMALWPGHPELPAAAPLCTLAAVGSLVVLVGPAWLASRHVTRTLQPAD